MESNWTITLDGKSHVVRAYVPPVSLVPYIAVHIDGAVVHKKKVLVFGELCRFNALGHEFTIRVQGYGVLGTLKLFVDGVETGHAGASAEKDLQPSSAPDEVLDTSIVEMHRVEEPLGEESREIDNSQSGVTIQRKIIVSREWAQSCVIEREQTTKVGGELGVKGAWVVDFKVAAEGTVRRKYELTREERRTYSEELTIDVEANKKVTIVIRWKQIWQHGIVLVRGGKDGTEIRIPYKVCMGPTFDQRQVDG